jgi:hypothetical protein
LLHESFNPLAMAQAQLPHGAADIPATRCTLFDRVRNCEDNHHERTTRMRSNHGQQATEAYE